MRIQSRGVVKQSQVQKTSPVLHGVAFQACLALILLLSVITAAAQQQQSGKQYTDKKQGFRLLIPNGWHEIKKGPGLKKGEKGMVALFESPKKNLAIAIQHLSIDLGAEESRLLLEQQYANDPTYKKISEEEVVLSGLAARKVVQEQEGVIRPRFCTNPCETVYITI